MLPDVVTYIGTFAGIDLICVDTMDYTLVTDKSGTASHKIQSPIKDSNNPNRLYYQYPLSKEI